MILLVTASN